MPRPTEELTVHLGSTPVAVVRRSQRGVELRYEWEIVERQAGRPVVSCSFPVGRRPMDATACFDGVLPEGRFRSELAARADLVASDTFGMLQRYGRDIDSRSHPGIVRAEHEAMQLAKAVGLTTVTTELREIAGMECLFVERFDRSRTASGDITRLHQEDTCQALGRPLTLCRSTSHGRAGRGWAAGLSSSRSPLSSIGSPLIPQRNTSRRFASPPSVGEADERGRWPRLDNPRPIAVTPIRTLVLMDHLESPAQPSDSTAGPDGADVGSAPAPAPTPARAVKKTTTRVVKKEPKPLGHCQQCFNVLNPDRSCPMECDQAA